MISPYCSDSDQRLHHHAQHTTTAASQTSSNGGGGGSTRRIISGNNGCRTRCRSILGYQQQLHLVNNADIMTGNNCRDAGTSGSRYSPHPNEVLIHHHGKLSIQPIVSYDDPNNCCLPPPSPAPNSDRYISGVSSVHSAPVCGATSNVNCLQGHTSYANYDGGGGNGGNSGSNGHLQQSKAQQHHQQQQQHIHHTTQSLSSTSPLTVKGNGITNLTQKYVSSMQHCSTRLRLSDRYREVPKPKSLVLNNSSCVASQSEYRSATSSSTSHPSNTARYVSSAHFLTQSTPLLTSDAYTYLSSTVHTPVKRYVPTPPPPNELYTETSMEPPPTSKPTSLNKFGTTNNGWHAPAQHVNTLPYHFRMKCCTNESTNPTVVQPTNTNTSHMTNSQEHRPLPVDDYYATSPRTRSTYANSSYSDGSYSANKSIANRNVIGSSKCSAAISKDSSIIIVHDQQIQTTGHSTSAKILGNTSGSVGSSTSGRSSTTSPMTVSANNGNGMYVVGCNRINVPSVLLPNNANVIRDHIQRTPSNENINGTTTAIGSAGGRICTTPVAQIESNPISGANNISSMNSDVSASITCLHCNTVRRTTGVHQTTQTTGPISPIPLQQVMGGINNGVANMSSGNSGLLKNVLDQSLLTLAPSTSESHSSPLSPSVAGTYLSRIQFSSKIDDNINVIEKLQQQQLQGDQIYIAQMSQQQAKNVVSQNTFTEHVEVVGTMDSIKGKKQQHQNGGCQLIQQQQILSQQQFLHQSQQPSPVQPPPIQQHHRFSCKKRFTQYLRKEISRFFGVDDCTEAEEFAVWQGRQRRLALRRFGALKNESAEMSNNNPGEINNPVNCYSDAVGTNQQDNQHHNHYLERPDILPAHEDTEDSDVAIKYPASQRNFLYADFQISDHIERKASVATMVMGILTFIFHSLNRRHPRNYRQRSRSFAPTYINNINSIDNSGDFFEGLSALQEDEVFFDSSGNEEVLGSGSLKTCNNTVGDRLQQSIASAGIMRSNGPILRINNGAKMIEHHRQIFMGERVHGWRTSAIMGARTHSNPNNDQVNASALLHPSSSSSVGVGAQHQSNICGIAGGSHQSKEPAIPDQISASSLPNVQSPNGIRGNRISAQLLDGVLENSRRSDHRKVKLFSVNDLDDRADHRPFFTYWINTVQILVLLLSLICYGIGPIGIGVEQKTGQVLVTSLSLQTVQHTEQRNVWIGPRNNDLVHMGAKFATCMRSDARIMNVILRTRRQERETACCIRNDDSGCVQSSQADCSVRGLFPTKSISTWKKWSPGESGPGGRISGSVCGLDPKYCDAPASIAPYEWPDDITKWPICRKTNSFSQRFRYKDHTAEHMVCEVIGHPCCIGVYGECRITTREYCDFVNGYFHEEASLCSQISCLNNVCGMLPFFSGEVPDQFYRLFTSLCLHAGIIHLAITIAFQHVFLADLERLIGPIRTAIVYIGSGLAGNLTSAVLMPYKPEVGPLASLSGVIASLVVLLILIHWKHLRKPHLALFKLICTAALLFGIGTLPWQLNFAGLLAGIFCGVFLTIALVPFVSITKYGRKSKINLIWSCVIFHLFIYSVLLVIFHVFPTELTSLNVGEVLGTNSNTNSGSGSNVADSVNVGGGLGGIGLGSSHLSRNSDELGSISIENGRTANGKGNRCQSMHQQYYYHHRSSDIIASETNFLRDPLRQQQRSIGPVVAFYHYAYHMNRYNNAIREKDKCNNANNSFTNYFYTDDLKSYTNSSKAQHNDIIGVKMFADKTKSNCKNAITNADRGRNMLKAMVTKEVMTNYNNNNYISAYSSNKSKRTVNGNVDGAIDVTATVSKHGDRQVLQATDNSDGRYVASALTKNVYYGSRNDDMNNNNIRRMHMTSSRTKLVDRLDTPRGSLDLDDAGDIGEDEVLYIVEADTEIKAAAKQRRRQITTAVSLVNVPINGVDSHLNVFNLSKSISEHKHGPASRKFGTKSKSERQMLKRERYSSVQQPVMNVHKKP